LRRIEEGVTIGPVSIPARAGLQEVGVALAMLLVLLARPRGITGGRELAFDLRSVRLRRARVEPEESAA
jgi:branched-chain amino acid transport system permease protein